MTEKNSAISDDQHKDNKNVDEQKNAANKFPLIVIGASAGGLGAIKTLVAGLPQNLGAAIGIVWHMSADVRGILPHILAAVNTLPAAHARDKEPIRENHIYIAPPDHHLLVEDGHLRLTRGPKENRFRPAVDPLFRSAAHSHGDGVIGIILSGALDDGTAGLWAVKHNGGIAITQDLLDAQVPSMPENAMREVAVDYVVPAAQMADLLTHLVKKLKERPAVQAKENSMEKDNHEEIEIRIAADEHPLQVGVMELGEPSVFTCPECHGVLLAIKEGSFKRYRCHTGHAFSPDSLLAALTEKIEDSIWNAVRSIEESTMLLNHMGDHFAETNKPKLASMYFKKAQEANRRSEAVRQVVLQHEQLSKGSLEDQTNNNTQ